MTTSHLPQSSPKEPGCSRACKQLLQKVRQSLTQGSTSSRRKQHPIQPAIPTPVTPSHRHTSMAVALDSPSPAWSPYTAATLALGNSQDPDSIPLLRQALLSVESRMLSLATQRSLLESKLASAVALQCPIRRLPNEVLATVFTVGVLQFDDEDPLFLSRLTLVCRHWFDVAVETPILWSRIVVGNHDSLDKARRKIERSKAVPLDISIAFSPRSPLHTEAVGEAVKAAMDLLEKEIPRWRSFRLRVPHRPHAHAALLRCTERAPLLEELTIQVHHSMQESEFCNPGRITEPLFRSYTPRLRACSFTSFHLGWDSVITASLVRGLKTLKLVGLWADHAPTCQQLLAILRACPQLEELTLRNISDVESDLDDSRPNTNNNNTSVEDLRAVLSQTRSTPLIQLPYLRSASFYYSGQLRTKAILSQISFPALEKIEFAYLDNITPILKELKRQALTPPHLACSTYDFYRLQALGRLDCNFGGGLALRSLRIESSLFNELKLMRLLRRLPTVTRLDLVDVEDVSSNLLKGLSTPPQAQEWILPRLETLSLDGCTSVDWDVLRDFIECRLAGSASNNPHAPRRLRSLDLTKCNQISREMVQWLRMYVTEVKGENGRGVWAE